MKRKMYSRKTSFHESTVMKRPGLRALDIELTERCNNDCIHCYINLPEHDRAAKKRELSTGDIQDVLKEGADLGCLTVTFTGGEPLLREDFDEIYLSARRLGLDVILNTNARLITPERADLFKRIPPRKPIEISLYGMRRESYEPITRSPGSFDDAWKGIQRLRERDVPFSLNNALLPQNRKEKEEFDTWASLVSSTNELPSYAMFFDLRGRHDSKEKNDRIKSLRISPEEGLKILAGDEYSYRRVNQEFFNRFTVPPDERIFICEGMLENPSLDAYGMLQPCLGCRHPHTLYNLQMGSLKDALENFFPKLKHFRATDREYLSRCARCYLRSFCDQCPAKSWMEHGTLDTPVDYLCTITHIQAQYLGLLECHEKAWLVDNLKEKIKTFTRD
jgi:radical SAM protein with 4Fe4S-binding SPASM domain